MYHKFFTITGKTSTVLNKTSHPEETLKKVKKERSTSLKMHEDQNKNLNKRNESNIYFVTFKLYATKNYFYCTNYHIVAKKLINLLTKFAAPFYLIFSIVLIEIMLLLSKRKI